VNAIGINPAETELFAQVIHSRARGETYYRVGFEYAGYARMSRKRLKDKEKSLRYGEKVLARYRRLYA